MSNSHSRSRGLYDSSPRRSGARTSTYGPQEFTSRSSRRDSHSTSYPLDSYRLSSSYYNTGSHRSRQGERYESRLPRPSETTSYRSVAGPSSRRSYQHDDSYYGRSSTSYSRSRPRDLFDDLGYSSRQNTRSRSSHRATRGSPTPTLSNSSRSRSLSSFGRYSNSSDLLRGIGHSFSFSGRSPSSSAPRYRSSSRHPDRSNSGDNYYSPSSYRRGRYDSRERDSFRYPPQYSGESRSRYR